MVSSRIPGYYKLEVSERREILKEFSDLTDEELEVLSCTGALDIELANRMIENVVGTMPLTLGIATNFLINNREYLIPMAIEEPSVVAAASNAARIARVKGGFFTDSTEPVMIGQIQAVDLRDPYRARIDILRRREEILRKANEQDPVLVKVGGGARDVEVKVLDGAKGKMVITHLFVDTRDAMGANAVNTMAEAVTPIIEEATGGRVYLRIVSNLATRRLARAKAVFDKEALGGEEVVEGILYAHVFAEADPYRATTHNKGIMNGVTAVALATANDTRAIEAGAHSYATLNGKYKPLTNLEKNPQGDLVGSIEMPLAVGVIGGVTGVHPVAKICRKILGVKTSKELAEVMAAVGLAQNLAALRALATEGIQRGHMRLHARNIAIMTGASGDLVNRIVEQMIKEKNIRVDRAKELFEQYRETE